MGPPPRHCGPRPARAHAPLGMAKPRLNLHRRGDKGTSETALDCFVRRPPKDRFRPRVGRPSTTDHGRNAANGVWEESPRREFDLHYWAPTFPPWKGGLPGSDLEVAGRLSATSAGERGSRPQDWWIGQLSGCVSELLSKWSRAGATVPRGRRFQGNVPLHRIHRSVCGTAAHPGQMSASLGGPPQSGPSEKMGRTIAPADTRRQPQFDTPANAEGGQASGSHWATVAFVDRLPTPEVRQRDGQRVSCAAFAVLLGRQRR